MFVLYVIKITNLIKVNVKKFQKFQEFKIVNFIIKKTNVFLVLIIIF